MQKIFTAMYISEGYVFKKQYNISIDIEKIFIIGSQYCGAGKTETAGQASRDPGYSCSLSPKAVWRHNFLLLGRTQSFLLRPPPDWMRPTHTMEGNLFKVNWL